MKVNFSVNRGEQIRAYYLFYIMFGIQIGVGFLSAPRSIFKEAHQDAWVSIIIAYLFTLLTIAVMFTILSRYENVDIFGIQVHIFGKWFGKFLGCIYILFFSAELLSVLLAYIEVVQIFIYPTISSFIMGLLLLILIVYSVMGGIRIVTGVVFLFVILSPWFFVLLYDPILRMESAHFFPLFEASMTDLLNGAKKTSYTFSGLEVLLVIYPFIDNKEKAKRPTYLGVTASAFVVLLTTIVSIGYFSPNDFDLLDWPVISLFKSVSFSFMERFDYLVIAEWIMVTIPTAILLMWAIAHGTKRLFQVKENITLYVVSLVLLFIFTLIDSVVEIQKVLDTVASIGFWIVFVYPFILLPIVLIKTRGQEKKDVQHDKRD